MRERVKFSLVAAILMTLTGLSWILPIRLIITDHSIPVIVLALLLTIAITILSVIYIRNEYMNAREGYPLMDERSKTIRSQTGNYAFFMSAVATIILFAYTLTGIDLVGKETVQAPEALFAVIILMVSIYLGSWAFLTFKWRMD
ncbi:MAG: hypothetical protein KKE24_04780 [Candidatus Thermoplasmatota archaeon]|nr:hypothetical protein [Candidatus Thermoplasmatota archaeon]